MPIGVESDILTIMKYHTIMIELSTKCNMRCVYCDVCQSTWKHEDIQQHHLERVIEFIKRNEVFQVCLHGHGEMTIAPNWHVVACKLLEMGTRLVTCTNLAKHFSPEEIQVLAQFTSITVSIDTIDAETSHTLRRGGDIRQILYNMLVINLCATQNNHNIHWVWNVVVCDKNISELINVCRLARMLNVRIIQFNDLQRTHPPMPDMADLRRIAELPDTHQAITMLTTCHNFCSNNHIILNDECLLKTLTPRP